MAALRPARDRKLDISVRGGGTPWPATPWSMAAWSSTWTPMRAVRVNPDRRTAWCQGGAIWGDLDRETQAFGLAVTGGRMPDTGVGGLTLGGGSGWI